MAHLLRTPRRSIAIVCISILVAVPPLINAASSRRSDPIHSQRDHSHSAAAAASARSTTLAFASAANNRCIGKLTAAALASPAPMMMFAGGGGENEGDQQPDGSLTSDDSTTDTTRSTATAPEATTTTTSTASERKDEGKLGTYNPLRLAVLKLGFTELRWTSPLNYEKRDGVYNCANCGTRLFDSKGKYDSGTGWPSFFRTAEGNVAMFREWDGRVECRCGNCGGHLGHVFPDGPRRMDIERGVLENVPQSDLQVGDPNNASSRTPRYCMNGAALRFDPEQE
eukprot:CAMPEP_0178565330 /NCGR_PEP_ID=MMETSP0697-20121206/14102_1 /TAXON_ID=265572 /ORGANISM="Extubocellulus spinifer, Strain CCMP396" /LENGTH=282 /DNA_ID=CAMNT_0020198925 /DNA_START=37 /DNA_END=885 /DNA_ORIENTATION=-